MFRIIEYLMAVFVLIFCQTLVLSFLVCLVLIFSYKIDSFACGHALRSTILHHFSYKCVPQVLDHLVIQKLNAEGRLEKKEVKKGGSYFDKVRIFVKLCS